MATPYQSGPHQLIVSTTGAEEDTCHEIRVPHRAVIKTIKFEQTVGAGVTCDFEVYSKRAACNPDGASGSSQSSADSDCPPAAYSVFGKKDVVAGVQFIETDGNYPYRNQDGTYSVPIRKLYVRVRPAVAGDYEFCLTFEMITGLVL